MGKIADVQEVTLEKLVPYVNNAKIHSEEQVTMIASSIREFGFLSPVLIDRDFNIIAGHGRVMAAKKLEMESVPCVFVEGLTEAQRKAYILADNRLGELADWDMDLVLSELQDLEDMDFDISLTRFDMPEDIEDPIEAEEVDIPEEVETRCKLGDIWQMGGHRLICGDSTDIAVIDRLMDGVKADMVFTDPPYGMKKESEGVLNDNLNYDDLLDFNRQWIPLTFGALKDNGSWYCWGIDEPLMDIYSNILKPMQKENKITFRNLITWDKGNGQGQLSSGFMMYPIADEKCLFVVCGIQCLTLNADQYWEEYEPIRKYLHDERMKCGWDVPTMKTIAGHSDKNRDHWTSKSQFNLPTKEVYEKFQKWAKDHNVKAFEKEYEQLRKEYEQLRAYFDNTHDNMNNVWHFDRAGKDEREHTGGHATPKPIALCSRAIKSSSREGEIVLDVFGGSGSTLIACEQLNRKCYMCELDEHYCDVIIQRWENLTGQTAELVE
jgi:DNA modification methylase